MKRMPFLSVLIAVFIVSGCGEKQVEKGIKITTTIFPLYDFAREVGGDKVSVKMMLPPGAEAHSFEPTPADIVRINESSLFIYIGESMEPWAEDILKSVKNGKLKVLEASEGISMIKGHHHEEHGKEEHNEKHEGGEHNDKDSHQHGDYDPHIWLDFANDIKIVSAIAAKLSEIDPANALYYKDRASAYSKRLSVLDAEYRTAMGKCSLKTIIYGGHFAFGYMAKRYGLKHISPYKGFSPDAEPSPKNIAALAEMIKKTGSKHIYYEELIDPKVAKVISSETGVEMLMLHGAHNLTTDEFVAGKRFIDMMHDNLEKLKTGLGCKQ